MDNTDNTEQNRRDLQEMHPETGWDLSASESLTELGELAVADFATFLGAQGIFPARVMPADTSREISWREAIDMWTARRGR